MVSVHLHGERMACASLPVSNSTICRSAKGKFRRQKTRHDGWTPERRNVFLRHLYLSGNVTASAKEAGMHKNSAYSLRDRDAEFRDAWLEALSEAYHELEMEMLHRARHGSERITIYLDAKGDESRRVIVKQYSDALGLRLLSQHKAQVEKYRMAQLAAHADPVATPPVPDKDPYAKTHAALDMLRERLAQNAGLGN